MPYAGWALTYIRLIDALSMRLGQVAAWALGVSCAISAAVAVLRYTLNLGSNAWLEAQWYLFAAAVMLGAPALLRLNEHVRVDVIYGGRSARAKAWIDLLGLLLFLLPVCWVFAEVSVPYVRDAYVQNELSPSAGGLLRWPVKALLPLGFVLLALQGVAEILKRIGFLSGAFDLDTSYERPLQ